MFQAQGRVYCAFNVCSKPLSRCTLTYKWCEQVGTATSTTTPWGDSWGTQSCTKSAPAQVKSAGSLLDEPSTPCTNKQDRGWWLLKRPYEWSAADEQLLAPYTEWCVAVLGWCWIVSCFRIIVTSDLNEYAGIHGYISYMKSHRWPSCDKWAAHWIVLFFILG